MGIKSVTLIPMPAGDDHGGKLDGGKSGDSEEYNQDISDSADELFDAIEKKDRETFRDSLKGLVERICAEHMSDDGPPSSRDGGGDDHEGDDEEEA